MSPETEYQESLWLKLRLTGNDSLIIGCIYRSPSSSTINDNALCSILQHITAAKPSHLLITGDFNYPSIDWDTITTSKNQDHRSQRFIDALRDSFLHQHVTQPTRHRYGQQANTLDLVITNEENMIQDLVTLPALGLSDHYCLSFTLNAYTERGDDVEPKFRYHKGDYDGLNQKIQGIDWEKELAQLGVEDAWPYFYDTFKALLEEFVPKTQPMRDKRKKLWMNKAALTKRKKKYISWKRYTETGDYLDYVRAAKDR